MQKLKGIHFYINVENLNDIVIDEEIRTKKIDHSIHALDTFFSSIESYGKKKFPDVFVVEKITGSRLHMYVLEEIESAYEVVKEVVGFSKSLVEFLNNDIAKYKNLRKFKIQVGACYGGFYNFEFKRKNADEETTIGYAANYAAKLQGLTNVGNIAISKNIFESLDQLQKNKYQKCHSMKIQKYGEECYYEIHINELIEKEDYTESLIASKEYANKVNLTDMLFRSPTKTVSFDELSKTECKELEGIPLFADIRGFTSKFDGDDENLEEMTIKTQSILTTMYNQVEENQGIHVQFQGDREFALFHNYSDYTCYIDAVKTGLKLIDAVKDYNVCIGVGQSFGKMYAAKIGARGEKDFLLIGTTVFEADRNEDEHAEENQLVISIDIYNEIRRINDIWASIFKKAGDYYYTTEGYSGLTSMIALEQLKKNNQNNNYNGAWGENIAENRL